ncbi:hypothetical protein [Streptomyces gossypii]
MALAVGAAAFATLGTAGAAEAGGPAGQQRAQTVERERIAASVLGDDYKITLTALRSDTDPYAASVRMRAFTQQDGAWQESDRVTVGEVEGWFWFPLTGSQAVCQFSTASTEPAPITVSLLVTPSIGCSAPEAFELRDGRFYRP